MCIINIIFSRGSIDPPGIKTKKAKKSQAAMATCRFHVIYILGVKKKKLKPNITGG